MKHLIYILSFLSVTSCTANKAIVQQETIPVCIRQKIEEMKNESSWNPPAEIQLFDYEGKKVYLISAPCCDFFNTVVDENCKTICAPSGGITGKGDGKCPDFGTVAKFIKVVWKDDR